MWRDQYISKHNMLELEALTFVGSVEVCVLVDGNRGLCFWVEVRANRERGRDCACSCETGSHSSPLLTHPKVFLNILGIAAYASVTPTVLRWNCTVLDRGSGCLQRFRARLSRMVLDALMQRVSNADVTCHCQQHAVQSDRRPTRSAFVANRLFVCERR